MKHAQVIVATASKRLFIKQHKLLNGHLTLTMFITFITCLPIISRGHMLVWYRRTLNKAVREGVGLNWSCSSCNYISVTLLRGLFKSVRLSVRHHPALDLIPVFSSGIKFLSGTHKKLWRGGFCLRLLVRNRLIPDPSPIALFIICIYLV